MTTTLLLLLGFILACYWLRRRLSARRRNLAKLAFHREYDEMEAEFEQIQREIKKENRQYRKYLRERNPQPQEAKATKVTARISARIPTPSREKWLDVDDPGTTSVATLRQQTRENSRQIGRKLTKSHVNKPSGCASPRDARASAKAKTTLIQKSNPLILSPISTPPRRNVLVACLVKLQAALLSPSSWLSPIRRALSKWIFRRPLDSKFNNESPTISKHRVAA